MGKIKLCEFGKEIKKKLVDIDKTHEWLILTVSEDTALYFDRSYLHKVMVGTLATPKIIASICKILELDSPTDKAG